MPWTETFDDKKKPDLSYLSAQAPITSTATQGMPVTLAAIANQNLAVEDANNARVNAVRSRMSTPPEVAPPPATTAPAFETATGPAVNPAINALETRRNQLLSGIDPDKPAIYPNDKRRGEMRQEMYHLTGILHQNTLEEANQAHENYKQHQDIQSAREFTGLVNGLQGLKSAPGTPEHATELLGLVSKYPMGAQAPAARDLIRQHAATHDTAATLVAPPGQEIVRTVIDAKGNQHSVFEPISPTSTYSSKDDLLTKNPDAKPKQNAQGGWYDSGEKVPGKDLVDELHKGYGLTPGQIQNPVSVKVGKLEDGKFVGDHKGDVVEIDTGKEDKTVKMSVTEYEKFGGKFSPETLAARQATPQFDTEDAARSAGHKTGDIVLMKNPKTGKYQKARLE